ncbi:MAG: NAD(P)-dependent glycerol-3-phosphate dehydrogenase [Candidatus Omnitrophica bacterium]|jgi:glycerol-3-phosphate dehydrogenase (NAD(P)+)|nr:NAD(P)-dependent glycerol-3-phosphate dehydrogenase [Candidatus Omnitrophota bacterium]
MNISIIGDGGWGTTLAILLSKKGYPVTLWGAFKEYTDYLNKKRVNSKFLPGIKIPAGINITHDLNEALRDKELIVLAVPSQYLRKVIREFKKTGYPKKSIYLSVTKGIEISTLKRISEIIKEELGPVKTAVLSGPTIAHEVAAGKPTTAVIASKNAVVRKRLQDIFITKRFRIYTNDDVIGVELGGSLKNVIAIACGISDGLGFGANTKAALLSRGLAEISRLGMKMGAKTSTFSGISGLGDLVTTCISQYSRNRFVGEQIGKGRKLSEIKSHMQMVAEGVPTTQSAYQLSLRYKVSMPITKEIYAVLYKNKSAQQAVKDLMTRKKKEE